jgi:beta-lactamase class D
VAEILPLDPRIDDSGRTCRLYGKTGLALDAGIGGWVGWAQRGEVLHVFALKVDMHEHSLAPKWIELGRALLTELGALPAH